MRITTKMMNQSLINNINTNMSGMDKYQTQIATTKRINRASDDPIGTSQLLTANSAIRAQEQYSSNMKNAAGLLNTVDEALATVGNALTRLTSEIAVGGANGTSAQASMTAYADEVDSIIREVVEAANTNYAGKFVFGGGKTSSPPFEITGEDSKGRVTQIQFISPTYDETLLDETYSQKVEIDSGVYMDVSTGQKAFHTDTAGNADINAVFEKMIELRTKLDAGDNAGVSDLIGDLETFRDNVLSQRTMVGAQSMRLEAAQSRSDTYADELTKLKSRLEDADIAEATIGLSTQKVVYEASLAVGAKIIQPSLIQFLS